MTRRLPWPLPDAGGLKIEVVVPGEQGRLRDTQRQCLGAETGMVCPAMGPGILDADALVYVQGSHRTGTCIVAGDGFLVPLCYTSGKFLLCRLPLYS